MAADATDLDAIQSALNDAAGKSSALWITFVTFQLYLVIAFGSVTHRDLLLETPVKLPLLNVDLPLVGFFVVAPTIFVVFYFYTMLQFSALASKAASYDALLARQVPVSSDRQYFRQRLDSFLVLQFLAGPRERRVSGMGLSLKLVTWLTLVGAPALVILFAQVTFLPFHHAWVVWLHRVLLLIVIAIAWIFWRRIRQLALPVTSGAIRFLRPVAAAGSAAVLLLLSSCIATYPGERVNDNVLAAEIIPTNLTPKWSDKRDWASLHEVLFVGSVDLVTGKPNSPFSSILVLTNQSFVDPEKLGALEVSQRLRGRDLRGAIFIGTDLRKADFTGSRLVNANFSRARLQQARFDCAGLGRLDRGDIMGGEEEGCSDLRGARFEGAELAGASFTGVDLQGAVFDFAKLYGAQFLDADARGASFGGAELHGARLDSDFQGASFFKANLAGADLAGGDFEAALFDRSRLLGTSIGYKSEFDGAHFRYTGVYRVRADDESYSVMGAYFDSFDPSDTLWVGGTGYGDFALYLDALGAEIRADEKIKTAVLDSMSILKPDLNQAALARLQDVQKRLTAKIESQALSSDDYRHGFTNRIYSIICSDESPEDVARGMLRSSILETVGADMRSLEAKLRDDGRKQGKGGCSGRRALSGQLMSQIADMDSPGSEGKRSNPRPPDR